MTLLLALLLAIQPVRAGAIHVLVEPGDTIELDGREAGVSSMAAGGLLITNVAAGEHEIVVRTPTGGHASAKVNVTEGNTSTVQISSLGLRIRTRGNDSTVEVDVTPVSATCDLLAGNDEITAAPAELRLDHVRPGPQRVALRCGEKHAASDLDIPAAKIVTVQANFEKHTLRIVHARERVTALVVPTAADAIMRLDLPFAWKRAIAAALPPGLKPNSVARKGNLSVEVTFRGADWRTAETFRARLEDRPEIATVQFTDYDTSRTVAQFRYLITFRN